MSQEKLFQKQELMILMPKEREDLLIDLKQELSMMENGLVDLEMDMESKNGRMVLDMKGNGKIIERTAMESLVTLRVSPLAIPPAPCRLSLTQKPGARCVEH